MQCSASLISFSVLRTELVGGCCLIGSFVKCVLTRSVISGIMSTSYQSEKRQRRDNGDISSLKIGTHNGTFHCDEVLGCFMLKQLSRFKHAEIVRSRDKDVLSHCDIVIDVGGIFDSATDRYDHHQRDFAESMHSLNSKYKWTTKLSSAGLVYYHYGREVLKQILSPKEIDENTMDVIFSKIYEGFIEEVDAVDNGINQYDGVPRYHVSTSLGARVSRMNPSWTDEDYDENSLFDGAMQIVGSEFTSRVLSLVNTWLPARSLVESAVKERFDFQKSGEIMILTKFCPWKGHLFDLEEATEIKPSIKYVIYQDTGKNWRVQCVPMSRDTFENRLSLPAEWRGVRDEKLSEISGIPDCIFVHASGFIGGNKTMVGAKAMATKALEMQVTVSSHM